MNTQPQTPASQSISLLEKIAASLQTQLDDAPQIHTEILDALNIIALTLNDILQVLNTHAASQPANPQPASTLAPAHVRDFTAETLIMTTDDSGKPAFKVKGFPFNEFGVRIWPETLPALGIVPADLKPGPNTLPAGMIVRAILTEKGSPKKIIGKGDGSAMPPNGNGSDRQHSGARPHVAPPDPADDLPPF